MTTKAICAECEHYILLDIYSPIAYCPKKRKPHMSITPKCSEANPDGNCKYFIKREENK